MKRHAAIWLAGASPEALTPPCEPASRRAALGPDGVGAGPMSLPRRERRLRLAVMLWGVLGLVLVLVEAVYRLAATAARVLTTHTLTTGQLVLLVVWTVVIAYVEGYRGFQQHFSPRVVARALYLAEHRRPLHVALGPLFCMALFHTTRRRLIATWVLTAGIVALILLVRQMPPPYRAIVDAGVAFALAWGTISILVFLAQALAGRPLGVSPEVPDEAPRPAGHAGELARQAAQAGGACDS